MRRTPRPKEDAAPRGRRRREAWIGLGANLGDPAATLRAALDALAALPGTRLIDCSSLYRSAPVDAGGPDFLNAVAWLATALSAHQLLAQLLAIEVRHGRERPYRNAPRTLDLDLLLFGGESIAGAALTVPHPRLHERAFVLAPMAELSPDLHVPGHGRAADLLRAVAAQSIERLGRPTARQRTACANVAATPGSADHNKPGSSVRTGLRCPTRPDA